MFTEMPLLATVLAIVLSLAAVAFTLNCIVDSVSKIGKATGDESEIEGLREDVFDLESELRFATRLNQYLVTDLDQQRTKNDGLIAAGALAEGRAKQAEAANGRLAAEVKKLRPLAAMGEMESMLTETMLLPALQQIGQQNLDLRKEVEETRAVLAQVQSTVAEPTEAADAAAKPRRRTK